MDICTNLVTADEPTESSTSKIINVEVGPGSAQSGTELATKSDRLPDPIGPYTETSCTTKTDKEPQALLSPNKATPETEFIYLVYHSSWGETPKRIDRAYRSNEEAFEYCRHEMSIGGPFWKDSNNLIIGNGLWALCDNTLNRSYVVEQKILNNEAPLGLKIGGEYERSHPRNLYLVVALQSGIVVQKPVYWTTSMSVLAVCKNRVRAYEVRHWCCEDLESFKMGNIFVKKGETWAIDVCKCELY